MKYYLQNLTLQHNAGIEITENKFNKLKQAKDVLMRFYDFTENYQVVVESYRKVEKAKHDAELNHVLYSRLEYDDLCNVRVILNSQIIGYFTSARYFLDSTNRILKKILSSAEVTSFNEFRSSICDSTKEYRFVEAFRNYVQHRGLPIHTLTYHYYTEDKNNIKTSDNVHSLSLKADRQFLQEDKKFKKTALKDMPEVINIIYCIRFHMEGLWKLHDYLVKAHSEIADKAREVISSLIKNFEANTKEKSYALHAFAMETETKEKEKVPLLLNWDDARRTALKRIGNLNNLHKRYITGKIQKA